MTSSDRSGLLRPAVHAAPEAPDDRALPDIAAYRARIGYTGPLEPTLGVLTALQTAHVAAIPFEAIDVLLGRGIDLAPTAIEAKLVRARRGGYCFEQNALFKRVLEAAGFEVEGLLGRVLWMLPPDAPAPPRSHMALRVRVEGVVYLVDVGFGSAVPTVPLRLEMGEAQNTPLEPFRVTRIAGGIRLEILREGEWLPMYELADEVPQPIDYEMSNWYTSTHPRSTFKRDLLVAGVVGGRRVALAGRRLTVRERAGIVERRELDANELGDVLREVFGLDPEPEWAPLIERAARADA